MPASELPGLTESMKKLLLLLLLLPLLRTPSSAQDSSALRPVEKGGRWGYVTRSGKCGIPFRYEWAGDFSDGLAPVQINGKCGFINATGKTVIPYIYESASAFSDGLADVVKDGFPGCINVRGEWFDSRDDAKRSFSSYARPFIEKNVNEWQKKGEFEKTTAWMARVNEVTRKARIDSLMSAVKSRFISEMGKTVESRREIVAYDADGEVFMIKDSVFGNILVPVPVADAPDFKANFSRITGDNRYCVTCDTLGLAEASFVLPDGRKYLYRNGAAVEFSSLNIDYSFDAIDFSGADDMTGGGTSVRTRSIRLGQSDVDKNIPERDTVRNKTFAVIIANENYQRVAHVPFAANDGKAFAEYCRSALGIPESNIRLVTDATLVNMWEQAQWLSEVAGAHKGEASIIFYYSGHGIPDEATKDSYLLPVDGRGNNVVTGYQLGELYATLSRNPTRSTMVFLDACFSGAERNGGMVAPARGVALKSKKSKPSGDMVVFSAAQGDETAYPYKEKAHGMFTYYLLKKLQETSGDVTLGELADYVTEEVSRRAIVENSKSQTPSVSVSDAVASDWKNMKL